MNASIFSVFCIFGCQPEKLLYTVAISACCGLLNRENFSVSAFVRARNMFCLARRVRDGFERPVPRQPPLNVYIQAECSDCSREYVRFSRRRRSNIQSVPSTAIGPVQSLWVTQMRTDGVVCPCPLFLDQQTTSGTGNHRVKLFLGPNQYAEGRS